MDEVKVVRIVAEKYCPPGEHEEHIRALTERGFRVEVREVVWIFSEGDGTHNQVQAERVPQARA